MDSALTKDAEKMLAQIYKTYLERRKDGVQKSKAKDFTVLESWPPEYAEEWCSADANETMNELRRIGFIKKGLDRKFVLCDEAIVYMEGRFKRGLSDVTDFLSKLFSAFPFL